MKAFILAIFISLSAIISAKADNTAVHPDIDYDTAMEMLQAGNYLDALKSFGLSAKKGNQDAQYQIGLMFLEGQGVSASAEDAAYWFRKAAQNGHAASQFEIGYCFATGAGVQSDERIAAEWFWRAAEQGDPDAAFWPVCTATAEGYKRILKKQENIIKWQQDRACRKPRRNCHNYLRHQKQSKVTKTDLKVASIDLTNAIQGKERANATNIADGYIDYYIIVGGHTSGRRAFLYLKPNTK